MLHRGFDSATQISLCKSNQWKLENVEDKPNTTHIPSSLLHLIIVLLVCGQVNPSILSAVPVPLSQGVLLVLILKLSHNLLKDTANKLQWMKEASLALNPNDLHCGPHMRPYLEQVYKNCHGLMGVPEIQAEQADLRLLIHVINSLLSSLK
jgi:enhancer of mRNA-decapping protein 4